MGGTLLREKPWLQFLYERLPGLFAGHRAAVGYMMNHA
jgi:hypothetical protein